MNDSPKTSGGKSWVLIGCAILILSQFIFLLSDNPSEFWMVDLPFVAFTTAISLIFLLPAYGIYLAIVGLIFRRKTLSIAARRLWFLGTPMLLLIGAILFSANRARPSIAISWITHGKPVKSIHSVHAARVSTMMSDRQIAWFRIDPGELRNLIAQHQLVQTNGINIRDLLSGDWVMGRSTVVERIPSFPDPIYYARFGSDEFQHPYRLIVLTNPSHDAAIWYSAYDRKNFIFDWQKKKSANITSPPV